MLFTIVDINPHTSPIKDLKMYKDFTIKIHRELLPDTPLPTFEVFLQRMKVSYAGEVKIIKTVYSEKDNQIVAAIDMKYFDEESINFENNKHIVEMYISFLKEYTRNKILKELLLEALSLLNTNQYVTTIEIWTDLQRNWDFWEELGAKEVHQETVSRLDLENVDWELMKEWVNKGELRAKEEEIEMLGFQTCPEEIIKDLVALHTDIMRLVPAGDSVRTHTERTSDARRDTEKKREEAGFGWYVLATKEKDGTLSGFTEVFFSPDTPHWVSQLSTGVRTKYQGRGLGKWLKAAMLIHIKENLPETKIMMTGNFEHNAPIMSINKRIGFKLHKIEKCYNIEIEELKKILK